VGNVDSEAINTAVRPEFQRLQKVVAHLGVVPVEIWLLFGKQV